MRAPVLGRGNGGRDLPGCCPSSPSPVALVPDPGVASCLGAEVGPAIVVDLGGEAQQPAVSIRPVGTTGSAGQAVLLCCTVEHVQRAVLDVRCLLYQCCMEQQI